MKYLNLIWRNLMRRKTRTLFTLLAILVTFVLFSYLSAIRLAFTLGIDLAGEDRLWTLHKTSLIQPLPISYQNRLTAIPGVVDATHMTWFGGKYQNRREGEFGIFPVVPEEYLAMYPEFVVPEDQRESWFRNRTGVVVGRKTANRFDWKVGDRVPIQGTIFRKADGGDTWEFEISGIYEGKTSGVDETQFLLHYKYFDEARAVGQGLVGWYIVRVDDPPNAAEIAKRIDARFQNSPNETETSTEKAFTQSFANQIGNIGKILVLVMVAVFFTLLLIAGNTMAQSVRERTSELAVLKTLGFSDRKILALVLAESLTLTGLGGGLGLLIGWSLIRMGDPTGGMLAIFHFPGRDVAIGAGLVLFIGFAVGVVPAVQALRLRIVDALRRT